MVMLARIMVLLLVFGGALFPLHAQAERRVALVIGNAKYAYAPALRNPANDAKDVTEALKRVGFEVLVGMDLDQQNFAGITEKFARMLDDADVGLFYYAGHGLQMNNRNYLVSTNARLESEFLLPSETVDLEMIVQLMESKVPINLVFLDACRNNPLTENLKRSLVALKRSVALGRGLARMEPSGRDTLIAFAAAPGQEAADGTERNSPFAAALLQHLPKPGVEVSVMLKEVAADVRRNTQNAQRPQQLSDMTRPFYFAKAEAVAATAIQPVVTAESTAKPAPQPAVPGASDRELDVAFWNAAQTANDCDAVRAYLQRFPNGIFVELANLSARRLCNSPRRVTVVDGADQPGSTAKVDQAIVPPAAPISPSPEATSPPATAGVSPPPTAPAAQVSQGTTTVAALPDPAKATSSDSKPAETARAERIRAIQLELYRLGCGAAEADGKWNSATRDGLRRFNKAARAKLELDGPDEKTVTALRKQNGRVCAPECERGYRARGNTCVAVEQEKPKKQRAERAERTERVQKRRSTSAPAEASTAPAQSAPASLMLGPLGVPLGAGIVIGIGRRH
jgi:uncharacterized caspase-like protein